MKLALFISIRGGLPTGDEGGHGVGGLDVGHAMGVISRLIRRGDHKGGQLKDQRSLYFFKKERLLENGILVN